MEVFEIGICVREIQNPTPKPIAVYAQGENIFYPRDAFLSNTGCVCQVLGGKRYFPPTVLLVEIVAHGIYLHLNSGTAYLSPVFGPSFSLNRISTYIDK